MCRFSGLFSPLEIKDNVVLKSTQRIREGAALCKDLALVLERGWLNCSPRSCGGIALSCSRYSCMTPRYSSG